MNNLNKYGETRVNKTVPMGTPIKPPRTNGAAWRQLIACQIAGSVCSWATMDQTTTNGAATTGLTALSQNGKAVNPVPKPVKPETKPPANAPLKISISVTSIVG